MRHTVSNGKKLVNDEYELPGELIIKYCFPLGFRAVLTLKYGKTEHC